jgi:anti-sigma regulatory factor (Ser/Thr protein kinase)
MTPLVNRPVQLRISSLPAHLPVVRVAIEKMCELLGFDAEAAGGIVLSVDEALTNIIRHAYDGAGDKPIEIELAATGEGRPTGLKISLRDYGRAVDPSQIKSRDLADVRPGGLGVHIMNECMDQVEYRKAPGGGTLLTMTKNLCQREKGVTP